MQYNQPYDQPAVPNASYVNANPGTGVAGSIPSAGAIEYPQREIVNLVSAGGLVPDNGDLTQLLKVCRSGVLDYFTDVGPASNAVVIAPTPAYIGLAAGTKFRVKFKNAITAASTFQVSNLAPIPIVKSGGNPTTGGEKNANDIGTLTYDGANMQLADAGSSSVVLGSTINLAVPGQYPTIRAALRAAAGYVILPDVYVNINIAIGYTEALTAQTGALYLSIPGGQRIRIVGPAMNGAFPTWADVSGLSASQVQSLIQARFNAFITCVGTNGIELHAGFLNSISNVALIGDGTNTGGKYGMLLSNWSTEPGFGAVALNNVWVHNFGLDGIRTEVLGLVQCNNVGVTNCQGSGFFASRNGVIACNFGNLLSMFNGRGGTAFNSGLIAVDSTGGTMDFSSNTGVGIQCAQNGQFNTLPATGVRIKSNAGGGILAAGCSRALVNPSTTFSGNSNFDINASGSSQVYAIGASLGTCSPAVNTQSSDGSRIIN